MDKQQIADFARWERVAVVGDNRRCPDLIGAPGVVIWRHESNAARPLYVVALPQQQAYRTLLQADLISLGTFDVEQSHFGSLHEISFDIVLESDNDWVEGCYRRPGRFWEVFVMTKSDTPELRRRPATWDSGVSGMTFDLPQGTRLDLLRILQTMNCAFGEQSWVIVKGPDSIVLR